MRINAIIITAAIMFATTFMMTRQANAIENRVHGSACIEEQSSTEGLYYDIYGVENRYGYSKAMTCPVESEIFSATYKINPGNIDSWGFCGRDYYNNSDNGDYYYDVSGRLCYHVYSYSSKAVSCSSRANIYSSQNHECEASYNLPALYDDAGSWAAIEVWLPGNDEGYSYLTGVWVTD